MDPPTEIMEGVDHNASPTDGETADAVSKVLDNDDLLLEIFFRLGIATTVVRAILVCKRWFFVAAEPFFLSWFRRIHPPRLLGFYVATRSAIRLAFLRPRFAPMPPDQLPHELAAAVRMAESYSGLDAYDGHITCVDDLPNDTMLVTGFCGKRFAVEVHWPMSPHRGVVAIPVIPHDQLDGTVITAAHFLQKVEDGRNTLVYVWLSMGFLEDKEQHSVKYKAHIYLLQEDRQWRFHSSAAAVLPSQYTVSKPLLVGSKIYLEDSISTSIAVLDLKTSNFSTIPLPEEMEQYDSNNMMLAPAYDSGIFLIHLDEDLELCIWLLHVGRGGTLEWLLVDVISLPEMFATLGMTCWTSDGHPATLLQTTQMGDLVEFVFLKLGQCAFCLDTRRRVLRKVYEVTRDDQTLHRIHPVMMTWPPKFPTLKGDHLERLASSLLN